MIATTDSVIDIDAPLPIFTKHPVYEPITGRELLEWEKELGEEQAAAKLIDYHTKYEEIVINEAEDPYRYGLQLESWEDADNLLGSRDEVHTLGGNRSGKSTWAADRVVKAAMKNPKSYILCWTQNPRIKAAQMQIIYERLPKEYRKKITGDDYYVSYTPKNGFSGDSLILNGSKIEFWTYTQYLQDNDCIEGLKLGCPLKDDSPYFNIGNWFDEYLIGPKLLETMRFRLATFNSKNICTFTPKNGLSDLLQKLRKDVKVLKKRPAPLLKSMKEVPYIEQPTKKNAAIIYFHSELNPYGGYQRLKSDLEGEPEAEVAIRAYGYAQKTRSSKFPKFSREANVIQHNELPFIKNPQFEVTRYMCIDPAGARAWAMLWAAVDAANNVYIYREWPDQSYGHWGEWGKTNRDGIQKSKPGPAQTNTQATGLGYKDIKDMITEKEGEEKIMERIIDPRAAASIQKKEDCISDIKNELLAVGIAVVPAPGYQLNKDDHGLQLIQDRLTYNTSKPMDLNNQPTLFISSECRNLIECMQEYTGEEGQKEAWKDFIDVLRYMLERKIEYVDEAVFNEDNIIPEGSMY